MTKDQKDVEYNKKPAPNYICVQH